MQLHYYIAQRRTEDRARADCLDYDGRMVSFELLRQLFFRVPRHFLGANAQGSLFPDVNGTWPLWRTRDLVARAPA